MGESHNLTVSLKVRSTVHVGPPAGNVLNPDGQHEKLPAKFLRTLKRGDTFRQTGSGAGGYGNPLERDPEAVMADVIQEKLTIPHVREAYGVVLVGDPLRVDEEATDRLRADMREHRGPLDLEPKAVRADARSP